MLLFKIRPFSFPFRSACSIALGATGFFAINKGLYSRNHMSKILCDSVNPNNVLLNNANSLNIKENVVKNGVGTAEQRRHRMYRTMTVGSILGIFAGGVLASFSKVLFLLSAGMLILLQAIGLGIHGGVIVIPKMVLVGGNGEKKSSYSPILSRIVNILSGVNPFFGSMFSLGFIMGVLYV